jgi:multidrug efflux pump
MAEKATKRTFRLSNWAVSNRTSVYLMIVIISFMGIGSYSSMPKESFPEVTQPQIYVNTIYPGNSPVDMENLVSRVIEKELNTINGLKKLSSTSIQDVSIIVADFDFDMPVEEALLEVKDAIDRVKKDLPNDLPADPSVQELDFTQFPVMNINISGDYSKKELRKYAEYLEDEIESLSEISAVDISGIQEDEVEVSIDKIKMEALEICIRDIENAIGQENIAISGGDIKIIDGDDISRRNIRIDGEFKNYKDIEKIIVKNENQNIVYLGHIAEVKFGPAESSSFARLDDETVLTLDVKKKGGENLIKAASRINEIIDLALVERFPKDLNIVITNDQSKMTKSMVANLENSILMGVILVVFVLMFFLGLRNSVFVGVAIPLSMLMGVAILDFGGNTMNMMVLFALILALGMLVDNGIVVVENIYRLRNQGQDREEASKNGVGEVASAIISSTATTLAAFLPLLFWKELMGEFMKFLPITLIIVLSSSLFVALVVNPALTTNFMKIGLPARSASRKFWVLNAALTLFGVAIWMGSASKLFGAFLVCIVLFRLLNRYFLTPGSEYFQKRIMPFFEAIYTKTIRFALRRYNPLFIFLGTILLMIGSIMFFGATKPEILFFPENEPKMVMVFIETPQSTDIEKTNKITKILEQKIKKAVEKDSLIVEAILAQVGENTGDPQEGVQLGSSPNKAKITVSFFDYDKRVFISDVSTKEIMTNIKEAIREFPEAKITVSKDNMGPPVGKPINVEVSGEDYGELIEYVEVIKKIMEDANVPGVDQLKTDFTADKQELQFIVNRDAARRFNLSTAQIGSEIRSALFGKEVSKFKQGEDEYKIQLRYDDKYQNDIGDLLNTLITFRSPSNGQISQVPISAVADLKYTNTYGSVKRLNMDRVITIFSEVEEGFNPNAIVAKFKQVLEDVPAKEGYMFKFTGEQEEQAKTTAFFMNAMIIAVFIIFLIIVTQFNSIIGPVIILASVMFSTIGVFLGFGLFKMPFVIFMCGIGIISLAGVVVNNAIVLIDYTNLLRKRKREELGVPKDGTLPTKEIYETIIESGRTRLRPVLLTAITTVLGLVPLAIGLNINFFSLLTELDAQFYTGGDNADFWGPMAWTIIFGLLFATFLTLIVVPVMYLLGDKLTIKVKALMQRFS